MPYLNQKSLSSGLSSQHVTINFPVEEKRMESEEISLIKRSQEGDLEAIEALYNLYKRPLFSLVYRHTYNFETAEDLLQDVFIKIFTHLQDFRAGGTFKAWIYRIALNTCYSYLRGNKNQFQKTVAFDEVIHTLSDEMVEPHQKSIQKPLEEAIRTLPPRVRSVFLLHDVQGFKHKEISQVLGCSVGTSKSQLFKARMIIRNYLKNKQSI